MVLANWCSFGNVIFCNTKPLLLMIFNCFNCLVAEQRGQPVAGDGGSGTSVGGDSAGHNIVASLRGDGGVDSAVDLGPQSGDDSGNQVRLVDGRRRLAAGGKGRLSVSVAVSV